MEILHKINKKSLIVLVTKINFIITNNHLLVVLNKI